jgi:transposase
VRKAIEEAGATLLYLPPYSPDFNPIEKAFSKLKALLRKPPNATSTPCGTGSEPCSTSSRQLSAQTSSPPQARSRFEKKPL